MIGFYQFTFERRERNWSVAKWMKNLWINKLFIDEKKYLKEKSKINKLISLYLLTTIIKTYVNL
jgi:hypothetical protein